MPDKPTKEPTAKDIQEAEQAAVEKAVTRPKPKGDAK